MEPRIWKTQGRFTRKTWEKKKDRQVVVSRIYPNWKSWNHQVIGIVDLDRVVESHQTAPPQKSSISASDSVEVHVLIGGVNVPLSLADVLSIMRDWESVNKRRCELIEKKAAKLITPEESDELKRLQNLAWAKRQIVMPLPIKELEAIEEEFRRKGLWQTK